MGCAIESVSYGNGKRIYAPPPPLPLSISSRFASMVTGETMRIPRYTEPHRFASMVADEEPMSIPRRTISFLSPPPPPPVSFIINERFYAGAPGSSYQPLIQSTSTSNQN
jgi:hypothetical protein